MCTIVAIFCALLFTENSALVVTDYTAKISPQAGANSMNLFLNNLAEIKISYSSKVPAKDQHKVTCSGDASEILRLAFENIEYFIANEEL